MKGGWAPVLLLLAALLGSGITARLGWWQLDRATQKQALHDDIVQRERLPALSGAELQRRGVGGDELLQRRVQLRGRWLSEKTVFLENRPMQGRIGFVVVTPFLLEGRDAAILVQRGWAPRDASDRQRLPLLSDPGLPVELSGRLIASTSRVLDIGAASSGAIRQNLDHAAFAQEVGLDLLPLTVLQLGAVSLNGQALADGLLRDWPAPDLGLQKHYGYAFQWFALCALILILYVWFQIIRPRRRRDRG